MLESDCFKDKEEDQMSRGRRCFELKKAVGSEEKNGM